LGTVKNGGKSEFWVKEKPVMLGFKEQSRHDSYRGEPRPNIMLGREVYRFLKIQQIIHIN